MPDFANREGLDPALHRWLLADHDGFVAWVLRQDLAEGYCGDTPVFDQDHPLIVAEARRRYRLN